jgi:hypothetical protein
MPVWVREAGEDDVELLFDIRTNVRENHQSREELASLGIMDEGVARMLATEARPGSARLTARRSASPWPTREIAPFSLCLSGPNMRDVAQAKRS